MKLWHKQRGRWVAWISFVACFLFAAPALAQANAVLTGTVTDASTKAPVADVVVTATSPAAQGEQIVVTDSAGHYRIPNLPPGEYTIRLEKEVYRPFSRSGIVVRGDSTIRVNFLLTPESLRAEEVVVTGTAPTVDVGASSTGVAINQEFVNRIAVAPPTGRGGAQRSFESVATVAPGAFADQYGTSINGTTSPENQYVIDGLSTNNPGYGINGTPLSIEFVDEVNIITGGYMPEYGRSTGGTLDVLTKKGSNQFHGSIFGSVTPGIFEGPREKIVTDGSTVTEDVSLSSVRSFGFDLGGPILKDRLWFYFGLSPSFSTYRLERNLNRFTGPGQTERIPGTQTIYTAEERSVQYIGKLTLAITPDHHLTLSVYGTPTTSGGNGAFGMDNQSGALESGANPGSQGLQGTYGALAHKYSSNAYDVVLNWSSAFNKKNQLLDVSLGWHHMYTARLPSDGSEIGSNDGLAGTPGVWYRRSSPVDHDNDPNTPDVPGYHSIADFENLPEGSGCEPAGSVAASVCPVTNYYLGGPDFLEEAKIDRYQAKAKVTNLFQALGHHVFKVGIDFEQMHYNHVKAYSGGTWYRQSGGGGTFSDYREFGYLQGPDDAVITPSWEAGSDSSTIGGFVQDSWSVADKITLNLGIRYDAQFLTGDDGQSGMNLPNQWSPRVGVVYDFTQQGRSKVYANYARYYESVPLDIVDRGFPGERQLISVHDAAACNPRDLNSHRTACRENGNRVPINLESDPNQLFIPVGGDPSAVDPDISAQSSDEIVIGGEYEILPKGRLGVSYTKRWMNSVIEDMSRDEAATYIIGNPGEGIAKDFPKATRDYDAVTLYFQKEFAETWLAMASYTLSSLRGNWAGLFRPETGQLDPNVNSDFDLISLLPNREGPLPGDRNHQLKLFAAKAFPINKTLGIDVGLSYTTRSGEPLSVTGSHPLYGEDEVFILPRGAGERLPWVHSIDSHLGVSFGLAKDSVLNVYVDTFNLFNFQAITGRDETYTFQDVNPIPGGTKDDIKAGKLTYSDGSPFDQADRNPNYDHPTRYQTPRQFRLGAKVSF